jgi:hypothetical protein
MQEVSGSIPLGSTKLFYSEKYWACCVLRIARFRTHFECWLRMKDCRFERGANCFTPRSAFGLGL